MTSDVTHMCMTVFSADNNITKLLVYKEGS